MNFKINNNLNKEKVFTDLTKLAKKSYSPYSHFRVSCILYLKNGQQISGVNVENAAYSPSICAERVALPQLIVQDYTKQDVELVAIYTDATDFGSPCGVCRQVMIELLNPNQLVWIYSQKGYQGEFMVKDFLPYAFEQNNLTKV
ncbi:cytidine deaminase [Williamsoniiplasma lucivorax]|uniref:Cytidine deaminase n=1 Tax=Williamsoniiplasma lucivorax TaxID=209274 RepID=A0A2S5RDY8_9MOLU|nr:cytidine deaminase [Williamsoniiplasma lucivorax]PPE05517.1 cytidine deaminase [Williamsoniiplasma lucivorax]